MKASFVPAQFFDGRVPLPRAVGLQVQGSDLVLEFGGERRRHPARNLSVVLCPGGSAAFIDLPDGSELHCKDPTALAALVSQSRGSAWLAWLERRGWVAGLAAALLIATSVTAYFVGVPRASDALVARVSLEHEAQIGREGLAAFGFGEATVTRLSPEQRAGIERRFRELSRELPLASMYRLEFLGGLAPNAFAFPGGIVVVTDALVQQCPGDELTAVLAHEIGHVENRHALRQSFRDAAVSALFALLTADLGSVGLAAVTLPETVARTPYSREFEAEADEFAFALLRRRGYSPALFATCLERQRGSRASSRTWEFLSTHPTTTTRAARARAP
jgi:Zn-dependent protease with chaperone function